MERATGGEVLYLESPGAGDRLDWRLACEYLTKLERQPLAITSHLICLPPPGAIAALKVAFLRQPMERIASAYRFQTQVQKTDEPVPFRQYLENLQQGIVANFQTRHLSPQEPGDWVQRRGWAARPELIDLSREDLFVGLVERYDDSIVALEDQLKRMGMGMDLAYARPVNTTQKAGRDEEPMNTPLGLAVTELDLSLYRRAEQRLEERLAVVSDLEHKRADLQRRRAALCNAPPPVKLKPETEWVKLPIQIG
ncbi:hypothetical protein KBY93_03055 [Synechococcus sp. J7-Johnson]|nr:sulfotransferase family protein [Synechococcus sp. J7-Johnson]MCP9839612.1 hypothetical protein [Synechococcus sp. J7-Johnson]